MSSIDFRPLFEDNPNPIIVFDGPTRRLLAVNDACLDKGGRLHLVKNVYATRPQLRAMYGDALDALEGLKARHDPRRVLENDFLRRMAA